MQPERDAFRFLVNSQSRRRAVVAASAVSYAAICWFGSSARQSTGLWGAIDLVLTFAATLVLAAAWFALVSFSREYGFPGDNRGSTSRDERYHAVRHRAYVRAYAILSGTVVVAAVYWQAARGLGLPVPETAHLTPLLFGLVYLGAILPTAVIAWTEQDAPLDAPAGARTRR